jgi:uncharacterized membrane protein YidH (DUF202 family)
MTAARLFDPGLQPERTELAWRRTALGIGVGSLVALRVLPAAAPAVGMQVLWLVPGLVGLTFAVVLWALARARAARGNRALRTNRYDRMPGGGLLLALTLFATTCGLLSSVLVLVAVVD